jgi:HPr kinase/phosphorylase
VELSATADGRLLGTCPDGFAGLLHVRDLGVIDLSVLFGAGAVLAEYVLDLVVDLRASAPPAVAPEARWERCRLLGVELDSIDLHLGPGRRAATLLETLVRLWRLRLGGHDAAAALSARQTARLAGEERA